MYIVAELYQISSITEVVPRSNESCRPCVIGCIPLLSYDYRSTTCISSILKSKMRIFYLTVWYENSSRQRRLSISCSLEIGFQFGSTVFVGKLYSEHSHFNQLIHDKNNTRNWNMNPSLCRGLNHYLIHIFRTSRKIIPVLVVKLCLSNWYRQIPQVI